MRTYMLVALAALAATGCGTLFAEDTRPVLLTSEPPGAEVTVDGTQMGETPLTVTLDNHREHVVLFDRDGKQRSCRLDVSVEPLYVVLGVLPVLVGVAVDAVTGEWRTLNQTECHANFAGPPTTSGKATASNPPPPTAPAPRKVPEPARGPEAAKGPKRATAGPAPATSVEPGS